MLATCFFLLVFGACSCRLALILPRSSSSLSRPRVQKRGRKRHKKTKTSYYFEMLGFVYMAVLTCTKTAKSPKDSKCTLLSKICTMIAHVEPRKLYKIKIATQCMHFICTFGTYTRLNFAVQKFDCSLPSILLLL